MFRICCLSILITALSPQLHAKSQSTDQIIVVKSERVLLHLRDNSIIKEYRIALGKDPIGNKVKQGDNKTPEGKYQITNKRTNSNYHLNLSINYPSREDIARAKRLGVSPGGNIAIHGLPNKAPNALHDELMAKDWTRGCIAMHNKDMRNLFNSIPLGTPINILP